MAHPVINPANAVTASRYLTLPPIWYFVSRGEVQWAVLLVIVCGVIDLFDGLVARAFNCSSGFGELFDAVTDGICYSFILIVAMIYNDVPLVPAAAILVIGALNSVCRAVYAKRAGRATNYRSFAMERFVGYLAYLTGLAVIGFEVEYYTWAGLVLIAIIFVHDVKRMLIDPIPPAPAEAA